MKKNVLRILITVISILGLSSSSLADSFGVHLTYPLTVGLQYTADNVLGADTSLRVWGNVDLGSSTYFNTFRAVIQIDAFFARYAVTADQNVNLYYGLGGLIGYASISDKGSSGGGISGLVLGGQVTVGFSFAMSASSEFFIEANTGTALGIGTISAGSSGSLSFPIGFDIYRLGAGINFKL
jgi:hypothetical protein